MRPIVIVLIVLALGTGLIAAVLVRSFLASHQTPEQTANQAAAINTQNVLVAARDITPGTVVGPDDIRWEPWPQNLLNDRFVTQPAPGQQPQPETNADPRQDFLDHIARRSIMAGEPMSREMVIKQGDRSVTSAAIAPGMRAVTINVTPASGVAGLILPGDHVDVVMNASVRDLAQLTGWKDVIVRYTSETIMKDVRVVAINQKLAHDAKEGVAEIGNLATLEVTPAQAERLFVSQQLGQLSLILRSMVAGPKDNERQQTFTMDIRASKALSSLVALDLGEDQNEMPADAQQAVAMAKERAKKKAEVKINRGGAVAIQKFGQ